MKANILVIWSLASVCGFTAATGAPNVSSCGNGDSPATTREALCQYVSKRGEGAHFENVCLSLSKEVKVYRQKGLVHALSAAVVYADEALEVMPLLQAPTDATEAKFRTAALPILASGLLELASYLEPSKRSRYVTFAEKLLNCRENKEHNLASLEEMLPLNASLPSNELAQRVDVPTNLIAVAKGMLTEAIPQPSDADYFLFWTTGNRTDYEKSYFNLRKMLYVLTLAECQEQKGRFVPKLEEVINTICSLKSWILPAHDKAENGRGTWRGTCPIVDLFGSEIAAYLACTVQALGDKLSPACQARIREQVEARIFAPLRRDVRFHACQGGNPAAGAALNWWISGCNNWNAVCWDNVVCAASGLIEDRQERAFFVDAALKSMKRYIEKGFAADGYCSEGMGYWNYGYGHHVQMGLLLRKLSNGKLNIFDSPRERQIAAYARSFSVLPGLTPMFSDGGNKVSPRILALVDSIWTDLPKELPPYSEFPSGQVWLFRDKDGLSVAFKGGHNDEYHNHNDVGSYWIADKGEFVSGDPGSEVYTRFTFSSKRYESPINNSYGHPVPVVGGCLQGTGAAFKAKVIEKNFNENGGKVVLDLTACYKVASLKSLIRTFIYDRTKKSFTVRDEVVFSEPTQFEDALISFGKSLNVQVKCTGGTYSLREEDIPNPNRLAPHRTAYVFDKPISEGTVEFVFHE